ncbi:MAG: ribose ABC transporter permease, partial [Bacteroidota bacterium]
MKGPIRKYVDLVLRKYGIAIAFVVEVVIFSQLSEYFFTTDNILNITLQISIIAIIAVGMTFVILTAGIDLSVGAIVAFTGVITTSVLKIQAPLPVAFTLALAAGLIVGALSGAVAGIFITRFNITPFIVTLALMTIWRGAGYMYTDGRPVWGLPDEFSFLGSGRLLSIPVPTLLMVLVYVIAYVVLVHTRFGRHVYAVGGNKEAARLAGISTNSVIMRVYIICGTLSALSGILLASRVNSGQPNAGLS